MADSLEKMTRRRIGYGVSRLEDVFQDLLELEYRDSTRVPRSFEEAGAQVMAAHLASCDRWEALLHKRLRSSSQKSSEASRGSFQHSLSDLDALCLEEISLPDLKVGGRYSGRVLYGVLCVKSFSSITRINWRPFNLNVINCLLEDTSGRVVRIMVNNGDPDDYTISPNMVQELLTKGAVVAIKDPHPKFWIHDHKLIIFVKNPENFYMLKSCSTLPRSGLLSVKRLSPERLLSEANSAYRKRNWIGAVEAFSRCISESQHLMESCYRGPDNGGRRLKKFKQTLHPTGEGAPVLSLNDIDANKCEQTLILAYSGRSAAWLQVKCFERALLDANAALSFEFDDNCPSMKSALPKTMYRKGRALLGLCRYQKASEFFRDAIHLAPEQYEFIVPALEESRLAYDQCELGSYDLSEYFLSDGTNPPFIYASYIGPVEIRNVGASGRGLVVKEPVVAGQLLLVSDAITVVSGKTENVKPDAYAKSIVSEMLSAVRRGIDVRIREDLVTEIAMKLILSPSHLVQGVYSLAAGHCKWNGPESPVLVPDMTLFQPGSREDSPPKLYRNVDEIDISFLRKIVTQNAICESVWNSQSQRGKQRAKENTVDWGFWLLPSFINHSCCPNSEKTRIGNFLLVRACQDLRAGTEITVPYFDNVLEFVDVRARECQKWGFECICRRCQFERNEVGSRFHDMKMRIINLLETTFNEEAADSSSAPTSYDLARMVKSCEEAVRSFNLNREEACWLRASFIDPYFACTTLKNADFKRLCIPGHYPRIRIMSILVDTITKIHPGYALGINYSAHLLHEVGQEFGWESEAYRKFEVKTMKIFRAYFGISDIWTLRDLMGRPRLVHR